MNIVFDHRPSYQGLQLRNFDDQSEKTCKKKSPSTLKRDRARMDNYLKKLEKKMSITPENAPHQISDNKSNFNVDAPDFIPKSSNIIKKSELVDNCDNIFPFAACDDEEFLKLMDKTAPMKVELKQSKFHLDHVSKELKSLQKSNATQNRCNVELIAHVAEVTLELKESKEKMTEMKRQEDYFMKQIGDLGTELEKAQSDLRTVVRCSQQRDEGYNSPRHYEQRNTRDYKSGHKGYRNYQDSDYHKDRYKYHWNSFQSNMTWTI